MQVSDAELVGVKHDLGVKLSNFFRQCRSASSLPNGVLRIAEPLKHVLSLFLRRNLESGAGENMHDLRIQQGFDLLRDGRTDDAKHDVEYVCPECGGSGNVVFGHETEDGELVSDGVRACWACNGNGHVGEEQVFRHRLVVLARLLAERAVQLRQDTPLRLMASTLEADKHGMDIKTFTEVCTMELQGHFECELWRLRLDLVETLCDLLAVPKPGRWLAELGGEEVPF